MLIRRCRSIFSSEESEPPSSCCKLTRDTTLVTNTRHDTLHEQRGETIDIQILAASYPSNLTWRSTAPLSLHPSIHPSWPWLSGPDGYGQNLTWVRVMSGSGLALSACTYAETCLNTRVSTAPNLFVCISTFADDIEDLLTMEMDQVIFNARQAYAHGYAREHPASPEIATWARDTSHPSSNWNLVAWTPSNCDGPSCHYV